MCSVKSPKIPSITTDFVNRMMTTDDYIDDDDQSIIRSSYCSPGVLGYRIKKDLGLLNEGQ
jgi:hypothetical protein